MRDGDGNGISKPDSASGVAVTLGSTRAAATRDGVGVARPSGRRPPNAMIPARARTPRTPAPAATARPRRRRRRPSAKGAPAPVTGVTSARLAGGGGSSGPMGAAGSDPDAGAGAPVAVEPSATRTADGGSTEVGGTSTVAAVSASEPPAPAASSTGTSSAGGAALAVGSSVGQRRGTRDGGRLVGRRHRRGALRGPEDRVDAADDGVRVRGHRRRERIQALDQREEVLEVALWADGLDADRQYGMPLPEGEAHLSRYMARAVGPGRHEDDHRPALLDGLENLLDPGRGTGHIVGRHPAGVAGCLQHDPELPGALRVARTVADEQVVLLHARRFHPIRSPGTHES